MNALRPVWGAAGDVVAAAAELQVRTQAAIRIAGRILISGVEPTDEQTVLEAESRASNDFKLRSLVPEAELFELGPKTTAFFTVQEGPKLRDEIITIVGEDKLLPGSQTILM